MSAQADAIMRGIVAFAVEEQRNRGLEEAARLVEQLTYSRKGRDKLWQLPQLIRARKRSAVSGLAEAKVASGKIAGLLPAPEHSTCPLPSPA